MRALSIKSWIVAIAAVLMLPTSVSATAPSTQAPQVSVKATQTAVSAEKYEAAGSKLTDKAGFNDAAPDFSSFGGTFNQGDYVKYPRVDFSQGQYRTLLIFMNAAASEAGKTIQVRLDAPNTKPIGTIAIQDTVGQSTNYKPEWVFKENYVKLSSSSSGIHDVYFTFDKETKVNLDWFTLTTHEKGKRDNAQELAKRLEWWKKAGFGQFIHWGAYAQLGGLYPTELGKPEKSSHNYAEWAMESLNISRADYEAYATAKFNPKNFDAAKIVKEAKDAGQEYIVFTSRHHEGYSMYDTQVRDLKDFSLPGTYGRNVAGYQGADPMKELAIESKKQGIKFGTYYTIMEWHDAALTKNGKNIAPGRSKEEFVTRMKAQIKELIDNYDTDILWFDGQWYKPGHADGGWWSEQDGIELFDYVRALKPSIIINSRAGGRVSHEADFHTPEQELMDKLQIYDWESCMTLNGSWGFHKTDDKWKDANTVIDMLVQARNFGGNLLLNVGPDQDGVVPEPSRNIMAQVGEWMKLNKETVQGAGPTYAEKMPAGIYATTKQDKVYLHLTKFPTSGSLSIPLLANKITGIKARYNNTAVPYILSKNNLTLDLTQVKEQPYDTVIEISVEGFPKQTEKQNIAKSAIKAIATTNLNSYYDVSKVIDGGGKVDSSKWASAKSATNDQMITLEFKQPVIVNAVGISAFYWRDQNMYLKGYSLEYWDEQQNVWKTAYTRKSEVPLPNGPEEIDQFEPISSSKIRLNMNDANQPSIYEFALYNLPPKAEIQITNPNEKNPSVPFVVAGTSKNGSKVKIRLSGNSFTPIEATVSVLKDGSWRRTFTLADGLQIGEVKIGAQLLDDSGTVSGIAESKTVTLEQSPNLAYLKPVTATPTLYSGYEGSMALDGNLKTRWGPERPKDGSSVTMTVYLDKNTTFNTIVINEWKDKDKYRSTGFKLEYFNGNEWKPLHTGTTIGEALTISFEAVTGSQIRYTNTASNVPSPPSLEEFEVYYTHAASK